MKNNEFDHRIIRQLKQEPSEYEINVMKEDIWKSLEPRLDVKRKRKKKFLTLGLSTAAALLAAFIFLFVNSVPGEAMMQSIRDMFLPEKKEIIGIEGRDEEIDVQLEVNEELNYVIYIDESRYRLVEGEDTDRIEMLEHPGEDFPDVYMEIRREDMTTEEAVEAVKAEIESHESFGIRREGRVTEPLEAEMIQGMALDPKTGDFAGEWNTPIHLYYVTDTVQNQVFIIKQVYFLEASEGHGARFHYMLESFEIIE